MTSNAHGTKHTCADCATLFYDLRKLPAACPKCQKKVPILVKAPRRRARRSADDLPAVPKATPLSHVVVVADIKPKSKHVRWK